MMKSPGVVGVAGEGDSPEGSIEQAHLFISSPRSPR